MEDYGPGSWFFASWCAKWTTGVRSDSVLHEANLTLFSPFLGANLGFGGRKLKEA